MKTREEVKELRGVAYAELERRLDQAHEELFNLRFRHAARQLANYQEMPRVKRRIARITTLMRERQLGGETD